MPEPKRPLKVFLCHASTDKPKVRELYRYLKKRGIQPWFDEEDLVGGQDWQVEIPKALATSDAIIICLTKNSVDKEGYIQKEIKFALDKALEMPEGRIFLIPVKFEECEVPFTLSRYQWVDLTVESGYAKMMKALKFRASQLERSTVEISKKDVEEENLASEKKERERIAKEAREKQVREATEKDAREKIQREIDKRAKDIQRKLKQEIFFSRLRSKLSLFFLYFRYYVLPAILLLGVAVGGFFLGKPIFDKAMSPTQDLIVDQTSTPQPNRLLTKTIVPSPVIFPSPTMTEMIATNTPAAGDVKKTLIDGMDMAYVVGDGNVESFWVDKTVVQNNMFMKFVQETGYQTDAEKNGFGYVWTSLGEQLAEQTSTCVVCDGPTTSLQPYEAYEWKQVGGVDWQNPRYEDSYLKSIYYIKSMLQPSEYEIGDAVLQVSWNDAKAYCKWAGKDLLTAIEWYVVNDSNVELHYPPIFEWADDKVGSRNRVVARLGFPIQGSPHDFTSVDGFTENRSANVLTFRCKENSFDN